MLTAWSQKPISTMTRPKELNYAKGRQSRRMTRMMTAPADTGRLDFARRAQGDHRDGCDRAKLRQIGTPRAIWPLAREEPDATRAGPQIQNQPKRRRPPRRSATRARLNHDPARSPRRARSSRARWPSRQREARRPLQPRLRSRIAYAVQSVEFRACESSVSPRVMRSNCGATRGRSVPACMNRLRDVPTRPARLPLSCEYKARLTGAGRFYQPPVVESFGIVVAPR